MTRSDASWLFLCQLPSDTDSESTRNCSSISFRTYRYDEPSQTQMYWVVIQRTCLPSYSIRPLTGRRSRSLRHLVCEKSCHPVTVCCCCASVEISSSWDLLPTNMTGYVAFLNSPWSTAESQSIKDISECDHSAVVNPPTYTHHQRFLWV